MTKTNIHTGDHHTTTSSQLVLPEILCVGLLVTLQVVTINWIPISTTLPILLWLVYLYKSNPRGYVNLFDAVTICDQRVLNRHVRRNFFKTVIYSVHFVTFLYMAILELNKV